MKYQLTKVFLHLPAKGLLIYDNNQKLDENDRLYLNQYHNSDLLFSANPNQDLQIH